MTERAGNRSRTPYYKLTDADIEQAAYAIAPENTLSFRENMRKKRDLSQATYLRRLEKKGILSVEELISGVAFRGRGKKRHAELNSSKVTYLKEHGLAEAFEGYSFGKRSSVFKEAERRAKSKAVDLREQADLAQFGPSPEFRVQPPNADGEIDDNYYELRRALLRRAIENRELGPELWEAGFRPPSAPAETAAEADVPDEEAIPELTQQEGSDEEDLDEEDLDVGSSPEAGDDDHAQAAAPAEVKTPIRESVAATIAEVALVEPVLAALKDPLSPPTTAQILSEGTRKVRNFAYAAVGVAAGVAGVVLVAYAIAAGVGRSSSSEAQGISPTRTPIPGADTTNVETRIAFQLGTREPATPTPVPPTATIRVTATLPTGREFIATMIAPTALPTATPIPEIPLMDASGESEGLEEVLTALDTEEGEKVAQSNSLPAAGGFPVNEIPGSAMVGAGLIVVGSLVKRVSGLLGWGTRGKK